MAKLPKCDCLNFCGDDPDLDKGKAEPCASAKCAIAERIKRLAVRAKFKEAVKCALRDGQVTFSVAQMIEFEKHIFG